MDSLQKQIIYILKDSQMSYYRMSQITGIPQSTFSRIIHGQRQVSWKVLDKLIKFFDLTIEVKVRKQVPCGL